MITLGADPEVFFYTPTSGRLVSAIGKVGGTKEDPRPLGDGYFVQEDNVAAEFNVPPASSPSEWDEHIEKGVALVQGIAQKNELFLYPGASFSFDPEELNHEKAQEFGCDPDYNAWTMLPNDRPCATDATFRTCGGHVHVGGEFNPIAVIRAMDLFLGVPSIVLDKDTERRKLYGKAGAFRIKPYGVEYRTLSNFWIFESKFRLWVWEATLKAVAFTQEYPFIEDNSTTCALIVSAINENDHAAYERLLALYPSIEPRI